MTGRENGANMSFIRYHIGFDGEHMGKIRTERTVTGCKLSRICL